MKISVVVPTYRRPRDLGRCLAALRTQARPLDELIVVLRADDVETRAMLRTVDFAGLSLRPIEVNAAGAVAAYNVALEVARGDIIAITDDDSSPHQDWLERIEAAFSADQSIGGVGGRDIIHENGSILAGSAADVGRIQWFGRMVGNHHLGVGAAREVDVLKGVNMSFRRAAIEGVRFDARLLGQGAQAHLEVGFCMRLKKKGWKVTYDPRVQVDHFPAIRQDYDRRHSWNATALTNAVHNETLALLEFLPPLRRAVFLVWALLVGTRAAPGLAQAVRLQWRGKSEAAPRVLASLRGRYEGWRTWRRGG
jgi:glycosyltransferase involved in cell wall biosynthesis